MERYILTNSLILKVEMTKTLCKKSEKKRELIKNKKSLFKEYPEKSKKLSQFLIRIEENLNNILRNTAYSQYIDTYDFAVHENKVIATAFLPTTIQMKSTKIQKYPSFEIDIKNEDPWNFLFGGQWEITKRFQFMAEGGVGERKQLILGAFFRF